MNKTISIGLGIGLVILVVGSFMSNLHDTSTNTTSSQPNQVLPANTEAISPSPYNAIDLPIQGIDSVIEIDKTTFAQCLVESGLVIYTSKTCPACINLVDTLGGYDVVDNLFVECGRQPTLCQANMQTNYVPEIQLNSTVYDGNRDIDSLAKLTGCQI